VATVLVRIIRISRGALTDSIIFDIKSQVEDICDKLVLHRQRLGGPRWIMDVRKTDDCNNPGRMPVTSGYHVYRTSVFCERHRLSAKTNEGRGKLGEHCREALSVSPCKSLLYAGLLKCDVLSSVSKQDHSLCDAFSPNFSALTSTLVAWNRL
jgi:hypothetical protein